MKNNTPKIDPIVEDAIFGKTPIPTTVVDEVGIVTPNLPTDTAKSIGMPIDQTVTIGRTQLEAMMTRLSDLESVAMSTTQKNTENNIFNPLSEVVSEHVANVAYHGDQLVVGYKAKMRPDKKLTYTWLTKDSNSGEMRTQVTLLLRNMETKKVTEETIDYVTFIEGAITVQAIIKKRTDIGKIVEHGLVAQLHWNGTNLIPTGQKVMTGAQEQKFIFEMLVGNEIIELPENVVNIK